MFVKERYIVEEMRSRNDKEKEFVNDNFLFTNDNTS